MAMRTTLNLDEDALEIARKRARRQKTTLGAAASELIRRGAKEPAFVVDRDGFVVPQLSPNSPSVSSAHVSKLLEEFP